jgi:hypothetical protein
MMKIVRGIVLLLGVLCLTASRAKADTGPFPSPMPKAAVLLSGGSLDALAGSLRGYLVRTAPTVLYEASPGWGQTARVPNGLKWTGKVVPLHPHVQFAEKNEGDWRRIRITAPNLADSLVFDLRNVRTLEPGHLTFDIFVAFEARAEYEHQKWGAGIRLFSGSAQARFHAHALVTCDVASRLEQDGGLLPDAVFTWHVTRADVGYDNLVMEHIAGVGGDAAKFIGDAFHAALREWRPSLERDLLTRADAAIVKAGQAREVRISLMQWFKKNGQATQAPAK